MIMNITDRHAEYAEEVRLELEKQGFRSKIDLRNEKIGFKIREHSMQRVPYQLITGDKELENQTVAVRTQQGEDLGSLSLNQLIERLKNEITDRK
jgi:threonyl-tRNA synthetase